MLRYFVASVSRSRQASEFLRVSVILRLLPHLASFYRQVGRLHTGVSFVFSYVGHRGSQLSIRLVVMSCAAGRLRLGVLVSPSRFSASGSTGIHFFLAVLDVPLWPVA